MVIVWMPAADAGTSIVSPNPTRSPGAARTDSGRLTASSPWAVERQPALDLLRPKIVDVDRDAVELPLCDAIGRLLQHNPRLRQDRLQDDRRGLAVEPAAPGWAAASRSSFAAASSGKSHEHRRGRQSHDRPSTALLAPQMVEDLQRRSGKHQSVCQTARRSRPRAPRAAFPSGLARKAKA